MKMYCIFSKPALGAMKGIRGKMIAQAGHAFLHAYLDSMDRFPIYANEYKKSEHAYKITCIVDTDLELEEILEEYTEKCGTAEVIDAGFTVFDGPTRTCIGIGPIPEDLTGKLKNLKLLT